jgi:hypothetical protein
MAETGKPLTYWDYIQAAFFQKVHVPGLGLMPANLLGLIGIGFLGIGFPALWILGLGLETAYLTALAGNARFQKSVRGRGVTAEAEVWNRRREAIVNSLTEANRNRHRELIQKSFGVSLQSHNPAADMVRKNVAGLLWTHLNLLASQEKVNSISVMVSRSKSSQEIADLENRIQEAVPESPLFRSLEASLALVKKRLVNLDRAEESSKVIAAEVERIERQINLLREETALGHNPEFITGHLDSVTRSLEETGKWLSDNADILGEFSQPLSGHYPMPSQEGPANRPSQFMSEG